MPLSRNEEKKVPADIDKFLAFLVRYKEKYGAFEVIEFTGAGEILLYRDIVRLVSEASKIMPATKLQTTSNISLLTKEKARDLINAGLTTWQISLDSVDNDEFKKVVGIDIEVDNVIDRIKMLWRTMQEIDPKKCELIIVAHRPLNSTYSEKMSEIENAVKDICSSISKAPYQTLNSRKAGDDFTISEKSMYKEKFKIPCDYLWNDLTVVSDGSVRVCCSDMFDSPIEFGNVFTDSIEFVIENPNRNRYKEQMLKNSWNELYLCNVCHSPKY
jgi:sulfatase maturation enzyme AslB (radical SAM superfamily)